MALLELLCKAELERDTDFLWEGVRALSGALMELEVSEHLGADLGLTAPDPAPNLPNVVAYEQ